MTTREEKELARLKEIDLQLTEIYNNSNDLYKKMRAEIAAKFDPLEKEAEDAVDAARAARDKVREERNTESHVRMEEIDKQFEESREALGREQHDIYLSINYHKMKKRKIEAK